MAGGDPLRDPKLKLDRARQLTQEIGARLRSYVERRPYRVFDATNPADGTPVVMVELTEPLPDEVSQLCGDIINNVRECLDQLAVKLAIQNGRGVAGVYFPTGDDQADFTTNLAKIKNLHPDAQRVITEAEPIRYGKGHALWAINKLWNLNKHRAYPAIDIYNGGVHVLVDSPAGPTVMGAGGAGSGYLSTAKALFHNAATANFLDIEVALYPVFSDQQPADGWLISQLLDQAYQQASGLLSRCEEFFGRN